MPGPTHHHGIESGHAQQANSFTRIGFQTFKNVFRKGGELSQSYGFEKGFVFRQALADVPIYMQCLCKAQSIIQIDDSDPWAGRSFLRHGEHNCSDRGA